MANDYPDHRRGDDKIIIPLWATLSWTLAALALMVLVVGLLGLTPLPYFPLLAFGLFILAVGARYRNDRLHQKRTAA